MEEGIEEEVTKLARFVKSVTAVVVVGVCIWFGIVIEVSDWISRNFN